MPDFLPVCEPLLAGNELAYVTEAVSSGWISSSGKYVGTLEEAFAAYCGAGRGTAALYLALMASGHNRTRTQGGGAWLTENPPGRNTWNVWMLLKAR